MAVHPIADCPMPPSFQSLAGRVERRSGPRPRTRPAGPARGPPGADRRPTGGCSGPVGARVSTPPTVPSREGRRQIMKVLIAGGIGGFATALSLHAVGVECEVFEQSTTIRELGVGINLLPHAVKELAGLGL